MVQLTAVQNFHQKSNINKIVKQARAKSKFKSGVDLRERSDTLYSQGITTLVGSLYFSSICYHWKPRIVMLSTLSSLMELLVVVDNL